MRLRWYKASSLLLTPGLCAGMVGSLLGQGEACFSSCLQKVLPHVKSFISVISESQIKINTCAESINIIFIFIIKS